MFRKHKTNKSWLVISPHADDAELGCGGTMARARAAGIDVHVAVVVVKDEVQLHAGPVSGQTRANELKEAMAVIGATSSIVYFHHGSTVFDLCSSPKSQLVNHLDALIADLKPDTVFLPVPSFHQEHQYVYECAMAAVRPTRNPTPIRNVYAYEYPAAGWGPSASWDPSRGGMYFEVTEYMHDKIKMLEAHKSQLYRGQDALISFEAVQALARFRGIESGVGAAELMYLLRGTI